MSELRPTSNPTPVEQKQIINKLQKTALKKDDKWYLVDASWYKKWQKYVDTGDPSASPGPIDNSSLLQVGGTLKEHLTDHRDFELVHDEAWYLLAQWYGTRDMNTAIARNVVEQGISVKILKVEINMLKVQFCKHGDLENTIEWELSKGDTLATIERKMREIYNIPSSRPVRLWGRHVRPRFNFLGDDPEKTVNDMGFYTNELVIIEVQKDDGSWDMTVNQTSASHASDNPTPKTTTSSTTSSNASDSTPTAAVRPSTSNNNYNNSSHSSSYQSHDDSRFRDGDKGVCGLANMGNTCFMNSAIQCLSNVPVLTDYFLQNEYQNELNLDNPLGMKGEIAKAYADLIRLMWSGTRSSTTPRDFKSQLETFAPQFTGYQQHDSQELLAFLLDGLHEDLNRIKKKPYVELTDAGSRPDEEVAAEAWRNYRKRNDSVIVDMFYGLLKSTVVCPECEKVSSTFDPFCHLSVPLPQNEERQIEVTLVPWQAHRKLTLYTLTVPKFGVIRDLCNALAKVANVDPSKLIICDVYYNRFRELFHHDEMITKILDWDKIHAYEMNVPFPDPETTVFQPVYQREMGPYNWRLFSLPLIVPAPKSGVTYEQFYELVLARVQRFLNTSKLDTRWWEVEKPVKPSGRHDEHSSDGEHSSDESDKDDAMNDKWEEGGRKLFRFVVANANGYSDNRAPELDGGKLRLSETTFLSANWVQVAQKQLYKDDEYPDEDNPKPDRNSLEKKKVPVLLTECIDLFVTSQILGAEDLWYCPSCKKHQQATKKLDLWSTPEVLVVHLKRFLYHGTYRDKIDSNIQFPLRGLDLGKYVIGPEKTPAVYDLIAVTNHHGGLGSGHYTAHAKNRYNEKWNYFDDDWVRDATEQDVCTKAAYVLLYVRRDPSKKPLAVELASTVPTIIVERSPSESMESS